MGERLGLLRGADPNLNANDPVWRELLRDVRFRRALSLGINRHEINQVLFFGLARESANTMLPQSPLYKPEYATALRDYDPAQANRAAGRGGARQARRRRHPPAARRAPGRDRGRDRRREPRLVDMLELVGDNWGKVGIRCSPTLPARHVPPAHRQRRHHDVDRPRASTTACPTAEIEPDALAPTHDSQFQWPRWGLFAQTDGHEGETIDMPEAQSSMDLYRDGAAPTDVDERAAIWSKMLAINADQVFTIGIVNGMPQPVVVSKACATCPRQALYGFEPGAYLRDLHARHVLLADAAKS